jgi:Brp/Blh family beta-carotene 15,15'-monooxygenase
MAMPLQKLIKIQGIAFSVLAFVVSLISLFVGDFNEKISLVLLAVFIVILGVPHGSLDTLFAKELFNLGQLKKWSKFVLNYLIIAALVVAFWWLMPTLFLILFLTLSIIHFSDDLIAGTPKLSRILYGGIIIFLPALLHTNELTRLYGYLIDIQHAKWLVTACHYIAFPWLIGLVAVIYQLSRMSIVSSLEISAVIMLAIFTPPLLAFTIYFCAMHSARHLIRSIQFLEHTPKKAIFASLIIPTLIVFGVGYMVWKNMTVTFIDAGLVKIVFVMLAALTVPHMMLLNKSGFSNWIKKN